jgi:hypothetical protein
VSYRYQLHPQIDLHVTGRIAAEDAKRQQDTAAEIMKRLRTQPGLILADEVGMGKTFVALAAAVSVALQDKRRRPVVVMVPPALQDKWPSDFDLFRERCLPDSLQRRLKSRSVQRGVDFLKLLDDPRSRRVSLIFMTHGAMRRQLRSRTDNWVKLALIQRAIQNRKGVKELRLALSRVLGELLCMQWVERQGNGSRVWLDLLRANPMEWLNILHKWGVDPEGDDDPSTDDDPVPEALIKVLPDLKLDDLDGVWSALDKMPRLRTKSFPVRLRECRRALQDALNPLWAACISRQRYRLPLLVLDEAHHLKNARTQLASLFQHVDAAADAHEVSKGQLAGVFERMLFLTATPFQLGHNELCSVLDRFEGINWKGKNRPKVTLDGYCAQISQLRDSLDGAHLAALNLDRMWGRLRSEDLVVGGTVFDNADAWWNAIASGADLDRLTPVAEAAMQAYRRAQRCMRDAETLLQPWLIRHLKPGQLPGEYAHLPRRQRQIGRAIVDESSADEECGLPVSDDALLPFLLAARACAQSPNARPVFAEGLASSYQTFLHTRRLNALQGSSADLVDQDDDGLQSGDLDLRANWYLDHLEEMVGSGANGELFHPKVDATTRKAVALWQQNEKILVFCHYIVTGKLLRQRISQALLENIICQASAMLNVSRDDALGELEKIGRRFDPDQPLGREVDRFIDEELSNRASLQDHHQDIQEVFRRYVRTSSFLVRYLPLDAGQLRSEDVAAAMRGSRGDRPSLKRLVNDFFDFLEHRCGEDERERYLAALGRIQTGFIRAVNVEAELAGEYDTPEEAELLHPTVRLVNGNTKHATRQNLMLAFNTPFYPDILVASSVMTEGVDLHLNCRHIIHHDLCWNPSTLEQRTGRVDRIGAMIERFGHPLQVYLPYIAATQDEKMYRVVTDRERWFGVVMGAQYSCDVRTTDRLAERVPLPEEAAKGLGLRLGVE